MALKTKLRNGLRLAWKVYKAVCIVIGTLVFVYPLLVFLMIQTEAVELPNGTYMKRSHLFANTYNIVLRREDGRILVDEGIEFVCFDDTFVQGYTFSRNPGAFIYEKGQDDAIFGRDPRYYEVLERSDLFADTGGCGGDEKAMLGFGILIKDPRYRR